MYAVSNIWHKFFKLKCLKKDNYDDINIYHQKILKNNGLRGDINRNLNLKPYCLLEIKSILDELKQMWGISSSLPCLLYNCLQKDKSKLHILGNISQGKARKKRERNRERNIEATALPF